MKPAINSAHPERRPPPTERREIDSFRQFWPRWTPTGWGRAMIGQSRAHLKSAGEGYWQHFRFATTFGLLAMAAGFAAILHAFIPGLCTSTASRIVRHLGQLIEDRSKIDVIENEAVEAWAFVMLLLLATAAIAPLWILEAPNTLRIAYTLLAYSLPAALMISNPELVTTEERAA